MAFCSKLGSLITQTISESSSPIMHLMNSASYMSSKLFVGGLSFDTNDVTLKQAFDDFGDVTEARVIADRDTGRSRGFGFVHFENEESSSLAMLKMDGQELDGQNIHVSFANERSSVGGGRGSYGGGYGGGGRGSYGGGGYRGSG